MTDQTTAQAAPRASLFREIRRYALFVLLALLVVGFWHVQPAFIRSANLFSILQAVSVVAILGVGVSITMAADGFDLSVGSIAASSVMAASYAMVVWQLDAAETIVLVLLMGAFIGLANGLLIVRVGVPDLLATLATMFLLAGVQLIPTGGRSITAGMVLPDGSSAVGAYDPAFLVLGRSRLFDTIPLSVVVMAVVALLAGSQHANAATANSNAGTAISTVHAPGPALNRCSCTIAAMIQARINPPDATSNPSFTICLTTRFVLAPRAMRTPISVVRWETL